MKYDGEKIEGCLIKTLVIPFDDKNIVFRAQAVLNYDDFDKLCPMPSPPEVVRAGGIRSLNTEDENYKEQVRQWSQKKTDWMLIKSLEASDKIEFETVDKSDPETWRNVRTELQQAFPEYVITRIYNLVFEANGLDQDKIDKATQDFLLSQELEQKSESSQSTGQKSTQSGKPVKDSV